MNAAPLPVRTSLNLYTRADEVELFARQPPGHVSSVSKRPDSNNQPVPNPSIKSNQAPNSFISDFEEYQLATGVSKRPNSDTSNNRLPVRKPSIEIGSLLNRPAFETDFQKYQSTSGAPPSGTAWKAQLRTSGISKPQRPQKQSPATLQSRPSDALTRSRNNAQLRQSRNQPQPLNPSQPSSRQFGTPQKGWFTLIPPPTNSRATPTDATQKALGHTWFTQNSNPSNPSSSQRKQ